jgi:hypothetical protein
VKLRWSPNAHLDLEGKSVSKWKLEENSRREWGSHLKIIHLRAGHGHAFPWAAGYCSSGGLAAIASRIYELKYPSHKLFSALLLVCSLPDYFHY